MNVYQEKFYHYILERVKSSYQKEAEELLKEGFSRQNKGTFTQEFMQSYIEQMHLFIQEQHKEEVMNLMEQFAKKL